MGRYFCGRKREGGKDRRCYCGLNTYLFRALCQYSDSDDDIALENSAGKRFSCHIVYKSELILLFWVGY